MADKSTQEEYNETNEINQRENQLVRAGALQLHQLWSLGGNFPSYNYLSSMAHPSSFPSVFEKSAYLMNGN